jgi:hypothetical protein
MSTALTSIFGNEISVGVSPRNCQKQHYGFAGGHGITEMILGSRGWGFIVTGRLRATGVSYAAARATLITAIAAIEVWQWAGYTDFTFGSDTYQNCSMASLEILRGSNGKMFHWSSSGYVFCDFVAQFIGLI